MKKVIRITRTGANPGRPAGIAAERGVFESQRNHRTLTASDKFPGLHYASCNIQHRSPAKAAKCQHCRGGRPAPNSGNRVDGISQEFGSVLLGILIAVCTVWIPNVGWVVALAWLFIGIAFAVDTEKANGMAVLIFLGLLLWFIPVIGGFLALALVLLGACAICSPTKPATAQHPVNQATFTGLPREKAVDRRDQTTPRAPSRSAAGPRNLTFTAAPEDSATVRSARGYVECRVQHSTEASVVACVFHNRPENTPQWLREQRFAAATWNRRPAVTGSSADKPRLSLTKPPPGSD
ncbi:hypothetical protein GCM10009825_18160 [Arthrobacter humicola]|uniref:DUF4190 domain-containing protein n=1 Tax=Arthrobacter humicola TaxID=409291 RepID=A0ABP5KMV7_9MICC